MLIHRAAMAAALLAFATAAPASAQSLNTGANGTYGQVRLASGFEPDPHSVTVQAGGTIDAAATQAGSSCTGMIAQRPDYTLRYSRAGELPLYISATSDADTTLVVRLPSGAYVCDDDSAGNLNPVVQIATPANGRYQIWVGTFGDGSASSPAMVHISELHAGPASQEVAAEAPNPSLDPAFGTVTLAGGFLPDPHTVAIAAGGAYAASQLPAAGCTGFIATAPDYRVNYTPGSLPLIFSVAAEADTTLVVNTPDGQWHCDDDGGVNGMNPMISFDAPQSGQYDVWVGTYAEGALQNSTLHVSELNSQ